jgi:hypothetical protein
MILLERTTEDVPPIVFVDAVAWLEVGANTVFYKPIGGSNSSTAVAKAVLTLPTSEVTSINGIAPT